MLPSFGFLPPLQADGFSLTPWCSLFHEPRLPAAITLSVTVGFGTTLIALVVAIGTVTALHNRPAFRTIRRLLAPALAVPHAAFAIGFAFLVAPSGWFARIVSPALTGWDVPPDLMTLNDPRGVSLMIALAIKESLFLIWMILAALAQVSSDRLLCIARVMGYRPTVAWLKVILPAIYPQIRLPIYAVLVTGLSIVDVALVLGPSVPPTLAVMLFDWFRDFDVDLQFTAAAGAVLQLGIAFAAIVLWRTMERLVRRAARSWLVNGSRGTRQSAFAIRTFGAAGAAWTFAMSALAVCVLLAWSVTQTWRWPDALPSEWSFATWRASLDLLGLPLWNTVVIGGAATLVALVLVIGSLEHEVRAGRHVERGLWLLYAPLLLPQVGFLFGVQVLWVTFDIDASLPAVIWTHLLFVLPFVYLALADPYRALDPRIERSARVLGASPARVLLRIKLPLLLRPVAAAAALGFAVSVAQYLATMFAGGGRIATLASEAIGMASGADRRLLGVVAFAQAALPLIAFSIALAVPAWLARNRTGLAA